MAEEVEIVGVDGGPASEATLKKLLEAVGSKGGGLGTGGKEGAKIQKAYNEAKDKGIKVTRKNTEALENSTSAIDDFGNAVSGAASKLGGMFMGVLGGLIGTATQLTKTFLSGEKTLTAYAANIPIIGGILSSITGIFDETLVKFQQLSTSGGAFNNSLTQLRIAAADSFMSLDAFTSYVQNNTERLAAFGGTVTNGALATARLNKALDRDLRQQLLNMGLSFEEINEGMADYMYLNRAGSMTNQRSTEATAAAAAEYTKNLMVLSKLTGKDIDQMREKQAAAQADIAFQMALARMAPEQRDRIQQQLAMASAQFGDAGAQVVKQAVLGYGPLTRETQLMAATMPEVYNSLYGLADAAQDTRLSQQEYDELLVDTQVNSIAAALRSAGSMEAVLAAGAAGLDGVSSELLSVFNDTTLQHVKFLDENGNVNEAAIRQAIENAQAEQSRTDSMVQGLTQFQTAVGRVQQVFEREVIDRISSLLGPKLQQFSGWLDNLIADDSFVQELEGITTAISGWIDDFMGRIENFGLIETLRMYIGDAFSGLGDMIKEFFFGKSDETRAEENAQLDTQQQSLVVRQTELQNRLSVTQDPEEHLAIGAELARVEQQMEALSARRQELSQSGNGIFDGLFGDWDIWEIAGIVGGITVAVVGLGVAANAGAPGLLALGAAGAGLGVLFWGISEALEAATGVINVFGDNVVKIINAWTEMNTATQDKTVDTARQLDDIGPDRINQMAEAIRNLNGAMSSGNTGFFEGLGNAFTNMIGGDAISNSTDQFQRLANMGTGLQQTVASISEYQSLVNTLTESTNSLDNGPIIRYTEAMRELVEVLGELNEELGRDNNGRLTAGTGENAGTVLGRMGAAGGSGVGDRARELLEQLNTIQEEMLEVLKEGTGYERRNLRIARQNSGVF